MDKIDDKSVRGLPSPNSGRELQAAQFPRPAAVKETTGFDILPLLLSIIVGTVDLAG
jgi:hypothetical protein